MIPSRILERELGDYKKPDVYKSFSLLFNHYLGEFLKILNSEIASDSIKKSELRYILSQRLRLKKDAIDIFIKQLELVGVVKVSGKTAYILKRKIDLEGGKDGKDNTSTNMG